MNLAIDFGNTFAKISIFEKNKIIYSKNDFPTDDLDYKEIMEFQKEYPQINNIIILSVAMSKDELKKKLSDNKSIENIEILTNKTPISFRLNYKTPDTLGTDRIAAIAGAKELFPNEDILVIDIGTAITYDILVNNVFLGGNISLGMDMRFEALNHYTQRLPLLDRESAKQSFTPSTSTKSAIYNGVINGIIFEIEGYLNLWKTQYPKLKIILTGGDAIYFEKQIKNSIFVEKNLVLIGLNAILNEFKKERNDI